MTIAVTLVTAFSNFFISLIRQLYPQQCTYYCAKWRSLLPLVIVVDQVLQAYAYEISKQLSVSLVLSLLTVS